MKKTEIFAAILLAAALFFACGKSQPDLPGTDAATDENGQTAVEPAEDPADAGEDEIDYESDLSTDRFDGYEYRILVRAGHRGSQYFEEPPDDVVDNATYTRNKQVEERFGVTISCNESTESNTDTTALNSILAGEDAYDIIFTHARSAFSYAMQGACVNVLDIKSLHLDKPWWSQDEVDNCTVNGKLLLLDGDISGDRLSYTMCLYFNKRIFDELGFDYPYQKVLDGEWTFDEFSYIVRKSSADLNGDGVMTPEEDQYGFVTSEWNAPINILYAGGEQVYRKNDEGELELSLYSNKTVQIFDSFFRLMNNESARYEGEAGGKFTEGKTAIYAHMLMAARGFRSMDDDFGILPYPKFDADDDYHTCMMGNCSMALIPVTVSDTERTGAITEALGAYGMKYVLPAFYDVSLKTKYSRDDDSAEMLDIIRNGIVFDTGYLSGGTFQSHGVSIMSTGGNFASWYAARESQGKADLEQFKAYYGK